MYLHNDRWCRLAFLSIAWHQSSIRPAIYKLLTTMHKRSLVHWHRRVTWYSLHHSRFPQPWHSCCSVHTCLLVCFLPSPQIEAKGGLLQSRILYRKFRFHQPRNDIIAQFELFTPTYQGKSDCLVLPKNLAKNCHELGQKWPKSHEKAELALKLRTIMDSARTKTTIVRIDGFENTNFWV